MGQTPITAIVDCLTRKKNYALINLAANFSFRVIASKSKKKILGKKLYYKKNNTLSIKWVSFFSHPTLVYIPIKKNRKVVSRRRDVALKPILPPHEEYYKCFVHFLWDFANGKREVGFLKKDLLKNDILFGMVSKKQIALAGILGYFT